MIAGSLIVGLCLLMLGWTSEIVGVFVKDENKVLYPSPRTRVPEIGKLGLVYTNMSIPLTGERRDGCCCRFKYIRGGFRH